VTVRGLHRVACCFSDMSSCQLDNIFERCCWLGNPGLWESLCGLVGFLHATLNPNGLASETKHDPET
jgi:hypothetical protein